MQEEVTPNYRGLKILVSVLGIVILIMLGLVAVGVALRLSGEDEQETTTIPAEQVSETLPIPAGSRLMALTPTDTGVYLHVRDSEGIDHLYLLDRESGALIWHRRLQPGG